MSTASILIVEDEVLVARDLRSRLERLGYDVVDIAAKAREAVCKAKKHAPDLVLMDIELMGQKRSRS